MKITVNYFISSLQKYQLRIEVITNITIKHLISNIIIVVSADHFTIFSN